MDELRVGVVGYGYWGPNIVRNFAASKDAKVCAVCDMNPKVFTKVLAQLPQATTSTRYADITTSPDIDVVAVVTPVSAHFEIAKSALENGKHVFVEKPFAATSEQAKRLIEIAARKGLRIMVDHTFLFTPAVRKIKELIETDVLGKIYYYDSTRINLGLFQHDVNVLWDLAPHDLAIVDYVLGKPAKAITANGVDHLGKGIENIAFLTLYYEDGTIAHFNVNWLSPVKIRLTLIGGDKKMLVWNDLSPDEKIRIYDRGVDVGDAEGLHRLLVSYRSGDMWAPRLDRTEALTSEIDRFLEGIRTGAPFLNDGQAGLRIVRMLEASSESIRQQGKLVEL
ncbi:MAG: Gfo/Idh/MocA family oxidoreductase [Elusimicrobiota bacterium]